MLSAACWSNRPNSDSRSNWLRECTSQRNCGDDLDCVCGVCTSPCSAEATCGGDPEGTCTDPAQQGIGSSCAGTLADEAVGICLPTCEDSDDCADGARCVQGACLAEPFLSDDAGAGGEPGAADAGATDAGSIDAGGTQAPPADGGPLTARPDATTTPTPDAAIDAQTPPPQPICDSTVRECCSREQHACGDGLICHIDKTCIAPATPDENGVATIATGIAEYDQLLAVDSEFVYGARHLNGLFQPGPIQLVRWPLSGGEGEVLADEKEFYGPGYPHSFPMRVDGENLYFVAAESSNDISWWLYSMPKDDSAAPVAHGTAGPALVDDAEHLYFANDGDSRIMRVAKATLATSAAREQVFATTTDAPGSILSLAINTTHVFVAEKRGRVEGLTLYDVHRVDKASLDAEPLGDQTKFAVNPDSEPEYMPMLASDAYLLLLPAATARLELGSLEVKPIPNPDGGSMQYPILVGDDLYYVFASAFSSNSEVHVLPMSTGRRAELLTHPRLKFGTMIASPAGVFVAADDGEQHRLVQIVR
jgi:hypothetical protein